MKNIIKNSIILYILFLFFSCKSFVEAEKEAFSLTEEDQKTIYLIIKNFEKYKYSKDINLLKENENYLISLQPKAKNNKYFEAKLLGVKTEIAFYKKENILFQKIIDDIYMKNPQEEWYYYLKALILSKDLQDRINVLNDGIAKATNVERLKLFLGETYLEIGNYKQALAIFDETIFENKISIEDHIKIRDMLSIVIKTGLNNYKTLNIISKEKLDTIDMLSILNYETSILDKFKTEKVDESYIKLLYSNFLLPSSFNEIITKKYLAFFIYNIFNPQQQKIDNIDKNIVKKSLIGDIKTTSIYYEPAMFSIKWGLMELDDGINFFPDKELKGEEVFEISKKTDILYRSRNKK